MAGREDWQWMLDLMGQQSPRRGALSAGRGMPPNGEENREIFRGYQGGDSTLGQADPSVTHDNVGSTIFDTARRATLPAGIGPRAAVAREQQRSSPWPGGSPRDSGTQMMPAEDPNAGLFGIDKGKMQTFSQAMLGLSSGLLSRGYGESGAQALGRGIQNAGQAGLQSGRQQRKQRTRKRLSDLANKEGITPEMREAYSVLAEMESPEGGFTTLMQTQGAASMAATAQDERRRAADLSSDRADDRQQRSMDAAASGREGAKIALLIENARAGQGGAVEELRAFFPEQADQILPGVIPDFLDRWMSNRAKIRMPILGQEDINFNAYPGQTPE